MQLFTTLSTNSQENKHYWQYVKKGPLSSWNMSTWRDMRQHCHYVSQQLPFKLSFTDRSQCNRKVFAGTNFAPLQQISYCHIWDKQWWCGGGGRRAGRKFVPMRCSTEARLIQGSGAGIAHFWHAICTLHTVWLPSLSVSVSLSLFITWRRSIRSQLIITCSCLFLNFWLEACWAPNSVQRVLKWKKEAKLKPSFIPSGSSSASTAHLLCNQHEHFFFSCAQSIVSIIAGELVVFAC